MAKDWYDMVSEMSGYAMMWSCGCMQMYEVYSCGWSLGRVLEEIMGLRKRKGGRREKWE